MLRIVRYLISLLDLLPANPFLDFTGARPTSTIGVVIFAAFLGFAYLAVSRREPENAAIVKKGIDAIYSLIMGIVRIVLRLTPYGILAIIARTVATSDFGAIYSLGKFVIASYVALGVMFGIHLIIIMLSGLNPITYVKKAGDALLFAFSSRSSAGTLPLNINTQTNRLGVPDGDCELCGRIRIINRSKRLCGYLSGDACRNDCAVSRATNRRTISR